MNPVQALAILSLGAFVTVLITAVFYLFTVRERLLSPGEDVTPRVQDDKLYAELFEQRLLIEKLSATLSRYTTELSAVRTGTSTAGPGFDDMRNVLDTQLAAVHKLGSMLTQQASQLAVIDQQLQMQDQRLARFEVVGATPVTSPFTDQDALMQAFQAQSERLAVLSTQVQDWNRVRQDQQATLAHYAVMLDGLKRDLDIQMALVQELGAHMSEQGGLLENAIEERRQQSGILEDLRAVFVQMLPRLDLLSKFQARSEQNRLTEIDGIGPVYSGKLYDAGITTFRQLAQMTSDELNKIIGAPEWRARSIDTESWIEQAKHLAAQREKVETES